MLIRYCSTYTPISTCTPDKWEPLTALASPRKSNKELRRLLLPDYKRLWLASEINLLYCVTDQRRMRQQIQQSKMMGIGSGLDLEHSYEVASL